MYLICNMTSQYHFIDGSCDGSLYGWESLTVYYHPDEFGDHRHCDSKNVLFLICHLTSMDHMFKGLCKFIGESPSE